MKDYITFDKPTHPLANSAKWTRCIAYIRKNSTGEVRQFPTDEVIEPGDNHPRTFNWSGHNFSCDCNRSIFFSRAHFEEEEWDVPCTNGLYSVNLENPSTKEIYYREFDL